MRNWINLVNEAKLSTTLGTVKIWTALLSRDLVKLTSESDIRGAALGDEVFVWTAYDETHFGVRNALGLYPEYDDEGYGFDFYAYKIGTEGMDDDVNRDEWDHGDEPAFVVNGVAIFTSVDPAIAKGNKQFLRMVGQL